MESRDGQGEQGNDGAVVDRMPAGNLLLPQGCFCQSNREGQFNRGPQAQKNPSSRAGMVKNSPVQESRPFQCNARGKTPSPLGGRLADVG